MFENKPLPYAIDTLEPVISAKTLSFHHGKHLQAYVDNLNRLLPGSGLEGLPLEEIVRRSATAIASSLPAPTGNLQAIFNNAGQVLNHEMYFAQFRPASSVMPGPTGHLKSQIEKQWGSLQAFQDEFTAKGVGLFGSGWVWLSAQEDGTLVITQEPGAFNPVQKGLKPLLTFDVWEHAYYLDWQNRRGDQLKALWGILDWGVVEKRYNTR